MTANDGGVLALVSLPEVAESLGIPPYRLRSWENIYSAFHSVRQDDGQRYYSQQSIAVIRRISELLYDRGLKSHEIVPTLKEEGLLEDEKPGSGLEEVSASEDYEGQITRLKEENERLQQKVNADVERTLREENDRLLRQVEDFGKIALTLKGLEDDNKTLREQVRVIEKQNVDKKSTESNEYLDELEHEYLAVQEELEKKISEIEKLQKVSVEGSALKRRVDELEQDKKALQDRVSSFVKKEKVQDNLQEQVVSLESERSDFIEKLEEAVEVIRSLEEENTRLKKKSQATPSQDVVRLEMQIKELYSSQEAVSKKLRETQEEKEKLYSSMQELEKAQLDVEELQKNKDKLQSTCDAHVSELQKVKKEHEKTIASLGKNKQELQEKFSVLEKRVQELTADRDTYSMRCEKLAAVMRQLREENGELKVLLEQAQSDGAEADSLRKKFEESQKQNDLLDKKMYDYEKSIAQQRSDNQGFGKHLTEMLFELQEMKKLFSL